VGASHPDGKEPPSSGDDGFSAADFPARDLLRGASPNEVLAKLHRGDPLELMARCGERLRNQALLLQVDRLYLRTIARMAFAAHDYRGVPPLDAWIADLMRLAQKELLSEDREAERTELTPDADRDPRLAFVSKSLGVEPGLARRAVNAFNRLPLEVRTTFFGVVIASRSPLIYASETGMAMERVRNHVRQALWTLGVRKDLDRFEEGDGHAL
jgi:hypothetical protein